MKAKAFRGRALPPAAVGFRPEFLDFRRGIRVGNLEDHERITRILKASLEARFEEEFVTERWGRGVYWRWIGFLSRANRSAKSVSSQVSFGCSKFFIMMDPGEDLFKCGLQVERGYVKPPDEHPGCQLREDWDWHRLTAGLRRGGPMGRELRRLVVQEGFHIHAGGWEEDPARFSSKNFPGAVRLRQVLEAAREDRWAGFQVYYPLDEREVRSSTGLDLVEAMLAVFREVTPAMNLCMEVRLPVHPT